MLLCYFFFSHSCLLLTPTFPIPNEVLLTITVPIPNEYYVTLKWFF